MKRLLAMLMCVSLCTVLGLGTTGCGKKTDKKDDTAKKDDKKPPVKENTVAVSSPAATTLKAGEKKVVDLTLTRGKDATKEVTFKVEVDPKDKGVSASAEKAAKNETKLTVEADKTAKGDFTITVTPVGDGIDAKAGTVKVKIEDAAAVVKKDVSLAVTADKDVTVKQGAKGEVTAKVALGKDLASADVKAEVKDSKEKAVDDKDIKASVGKLDKGEAKVTITVGEAAAPGDYVVTITATAEGATAATAKVAVKVEKK